MSRATETSMINGEFIKTENGYEYTVDVTEAHLNNHGTVHGGILYMICCEAIVRTAEECGRACVGMDGSIQYYRAAAAGDKLTAMVSERKDGKKVASYMVELFNQNGKLLCDCMFKNMYLD